MADSNGIERRESHPILIFTHWDRWRTEKIHRSHNPGLITVKPGNALVVWKKY
jgi:hypothetical protein